MEDQHFLDTEHSNTQPERPTFLTVLCIITFVVSGFWFLSSVYSAITYDVEEQIAVNEATIENLYQLAEADETGGMEQVIPAMQVFNEENIEYASYLIIINILGFFLLNH